MDSASFGRSSLHIEMIKNSKCQRGGKDVAESIDFSIEVYKHYGLDLLKMKENGEEHDWGICKKEDVAECTGNMAGFGVDQSQQIIIDYDKDYDWALVRRYAKKCGTS